MTRKMIFICYLIKKTLFSSAIHNLIKKKSCLIFNCKRFESEEIFVLINAFDKIPLWKEKNEILYKKETK